MISLRFRNNSSQGKVPVASFLPIAVVGSKRSWATATFNGVNERFPCVIHIFTLDKFVYDFFFYARFRLTQNHRSLYIVLQQC